jgi:hypothetical protein
MAQLNNQEFTDLIVLLAEHLRFERLHEHLLKANALVSRKRPPTVQALAGQLYQLSAGLRRPHPARYAIEILWQEMVSELVNDEQASTLQTLADRINACLTERLEIIPEKGPELIAALGAYHQALAALTTEQIASLELLLRASKDVAQFFRAHNSEITQQESGEPMMKSEE